METIVDDKNGIVAEIVDLCLEFGLLKIFA